jgi:hypothetical protein
VAMHNQATPMSSKEVRRSGVAKNPLYLAIALPREQARSRPRSTG